MNWSWCSSPCKCWCNYQACVNLISTPYLKTSVFRTNVIQTLNVPVEDETRIVDGNNPYFDWWSAVWFAISHRYDLPKITGEIQVAKIASLENKKVDFQVAEMATKMARGRGTLGAQKSRKTRSRQNFLPASEDFATKTPCTHLHQHYSFYKFNNILYLPFCISKATMAPVAAPSKCSLSSR